MRFLLWTSVLLFGWAPALCASGKLGKIRKEVKPAESKDDDDDEDKKKSKSKVSRIRRDVSPAPTPAPTHHHHRPRQRNAFCYDDDSTLGIFLGLTLADHNAPPPDVGVTHLSGGQPIDNLDPTGDNLPVRHVGPTRDYFPPYPYYASFDGYVQQLPELNPEESELLDAGALRIGLEDGNDFDGLNRLKFSALLQTSSGLGLHTRVNWLSEELEDGGSDNLTLGTTDLIYYFLTSPRFQSFVGVGVRFLHDQGDTDLGYNLSLGFDVFPSDPVVISVVLDWGTVGEADVFHVQGTVGYSLGHVEIFAGYDYREIGSVDVQGPLAGLRLWF